MRANLICSKKLCRYHEEIISHISIYAIFSYINCMRAYKEYFIFFGNKLELAELLTVISALHTV